MYCYSCHGTLCQAVLTLKLVARSDTGVWAPRSNTFTVTYDVWEGFVLLLLLLLLLNYVFIQPFKHN